MSTRRPLKEGYLIKGYTIGEVLGGGGFSIVYLARNELSRNKFVIKEYCPQGLVERGRQGELETTGALAESTFKYGMGRFRLEAERMVKVNHPNLIGIEEYFEANNTIYMVMHHEEGRDLNWFISKFGGNLDWDFLQRVFPAIGSGLWLMHQQDVVHLDIKPANILLRTNGQPLLLDFGAAKTIGESKRLNSLQTLTHGFAPPEQYLDGDLNITTDIYAFAATIYNCITGRTPASAMKRRSGELIEKLVFTRRDSYPYPLLQTVEAALSLNQEERPPDMRSFISLAFEVDIGATESAGTAVNA